MNPVLSVLLLTYNHEAFIAESIESALNQKTDFEYEILVGEDCSTDNTREIVKEYASKYPNKIKLISSDSNVGAIKNEIRLYEASRGIYLTFLEGDDYWILENKLQMQKDFLDSNPDYGLVHSDVDLLYHKSGKLIRNLNTSTKVVVNNDTIYEDLLKPGHIIKTMTACFRKDILSKHFDYNIVLERNWQLTDLPIWLTLCFNSKSHYINESTAVYRLLEESASRSIDYQKKYSFHKSVFDIKLYFIEKHKSSEKIKLETELLKYSTLVADAVNLKDKNKIEIYLKELKYRKGNISMKIHLRILFFYLKHHFKNLLSKRST